MGDCALYIHFPYCKHKCIYCDFYSITVLKSKKLFVHSLLKEIQLYKSTPPFYMNSFSTLYFGGGTPSLLSPEEFTLILNTIKTSFQLDGDAEISIEANPGTAPEKNLIAYKKAGINRLTLGVQSLHDGELKRLTRIHSSTGAVKAFHSARQAGFDNLGIDLIFGIPGQLLLSWRETLTKAVDLQPQHVSMYGLTYESGTPLTRAAEKGELSKCDEELERDMYLTGIEFLEKAGYEHYEISNFALPGARSRHNQKYWDGSFYLGFGPSAHSYDGGHRWWNAANVENYIKTLTKDQLPVEKKERLAKNQKLEELILLGLRRVEGLRLAEWKQKSKQDLLQQAERILTLLGGFETTIPPFKPSKTGKLLTICNQSLCLTREGLLLYDKICEKLLEII